MKKHNFSAGPSILPSEVFKKCSDAVIEFETMGLSILEISHRSKAFVEVMENARKLVLEIMNLQNKGYQVLFLQGGASMEFLRVPYNLMKKEGKAAYLDSGTWAHNALTEAQNFGETLIVGSSKVNGYTSIPKNYEIPSEADYFHCTSNNTIFGTQMKSFPKTKVPVVCDMSSDIFSRSLDFEQFGLIYAGAQKNLGPAGVTLIVVKEAILNQTGRKIPNILNYQKHIDKESMYNTPPVFAVYACYLTLQWLQQQGGISEIEKKNEIKAKLLYDELDRNPLFKTTVAKEDRSLMNITFLLNDDRHAPAFEKLCDQNNISGLKGHRSVGGYRASVYNAMPIESIEVLVATLQQLEKQF